MEPAKSPKSVLVVDDEPAVATSIRRILEHAGHRVTCILDARTAKERIEREAFDVIVTDIFMPEIDGAELIQVARKHWPRTSIIAVSGGGSYFTSPEALDIAGKVGANALLQKPFNPAELIACLNSLHPAA